MIKTINLEPTHIKITQVSKKSLVCDSTRNTPTNVMGMSSQTESERELSPSVSIGRCECETGQQP